MAPRVEEVAQLLLPEELAQQVAVERERLRLALGQRRVALVQERGDVGERQRARERRGGAGLDLDDADLAAAHLARAASRSAGTSKTSCRHSR